MSRHPVNSLTRTWMQQALLQLLKKKSLPEITVTELTRTAGVARITFYRNYTDITDVIFDYLKMQQFGLLQYPHSQEYLPLFIRQHFIFFSENRLLFNCILENNLISRLYIALDEQFATYGNVLAAAYGFESHYELSALSGIFLKILMDWLREGMVEDIESMSAEVFSIITKFNYISNTSLQDLE